MVGSQTTQTTQTTQKRIYDNGEHDEYNLQ